MNRIELIGSLNALFEKDLILNHNELLDIIIASFFLVLRGAGSIGRTVT
jgi:hypothetical protein